MQSHYKYKALFSAVAAIVGAGPLAAIGADIDTLPQITVLGSSEARPMLSEPQPAPKSSVSKTGIDLLGGAGQTSVYAPLDLLPSVIVASPDPYGLSPTRNINIRGKGDFHLTRNVEGVPLYGIVGGTDLFDLENVAQEDLYRGALAANLGLGVSNASGAVDQLLLGPQARFGVSARQTFGSYDFRRTFVRVDTGAFGPGATRLFVSASDSDTNQWTGAGSLSRKNAMIGISQQFGSAVKADLDMVYNKFKGNSYRSLSYAQIQALDSNYTYAYNPTLSGNAATDVNYFNFNRSEYENFAALAKVEVALSENQYLLFKPYYWTDNGAQYSASGANVQLWRQQNDNVGAVLEYHARLGAGTSLVAGYWGQSMQPPPPPTDQTKFVVTANGSLSFASWATLARIDSFITNSPFVQLTQTAGNTVVSGGLRYMDLGAPKMQYYKTAGLPNASYDQIWDSHPVPDGNAFVAEKDYRQFLPNLGITQTLTAQWSASASWGRKFGRPDWGPQASNFISNEAAFAAKGLNLQALANLVKPELSDQFDLSARYSNAGLNLVPTIFAAKNRNRQVMVVDPALGGLSYYQGSAKTTQYGAELEASYQIGKSWSLFGSGTLARETYDQDTPTLSGGNALATKGKQIPNAPKAMLKGGLTWTAGPWSVSPVLRYVGQRYGDSAQTQPVGAYALADFNASYDFGHEIRLALTVANLFDRSYVAEITPNDTNLNGASSFYAGAPRTAALTLSARF